MPPSRRTLSSNPEAVRSREPSCQARARAALSRASPVPVQQRRSGSGVSHARNAGVNHHPSCHRPLDGLPLHDLSTLRLDPPRTPW